MQSGRLTLQKDQMATDAWFRSRFTIEPMLLTRSSCDPKTRFSSITTAPTRSSARSKEGEMKAPGHPERRGDGETRRRGDGETGRRGDGETGRRGDGETGRWGDGETGR